ncbi:ArsR/SmtB family transcription factor [Bacillus tropicus]|uniref:ArsR/SmtB family transcription factor n=1 Tax=Bacillus tropicus TaxID=2026188 RepID=UPI003D1DAAC5
MTNAFYTEKNELERAAEILRVLAHPARLQIVHQLIKKKKSLHVSELQKSLSMLQFTVSQHLNKMRGHRVVSYERKGKEIHYRVDDELVKKTVKVLIG